MNFLVTRILGIALAYIAAAVVSTYFGVLYDFLFPYATGGSFIGDSDTLNWIIGFAPAVVFLLTFLLHLQGGKHIWAWNIVALVPVILFAALLDPQHIYFPLILGFIGWGFGTVAHNTLAKFAPKFLAKIS
jgi:hypothetical protein